MKSRAQVFGHPIHPMLIAFPLGLFPAALVFDVVWLFTRDPFWFRAAGWLLVLGLIGTIAAVIPGLIDYVQTVLPATREGDRARQRATWHMWLGFTTVLLGIVASAGHLSTTPGEARAGWPLAAVVALNLLLIPQGYLGGSLTYEHAIAVHTEPGASGGPTGGGPPRAGAP